MSGRSSTDDALLGIQLCLIQSPTLVWAILTSLQENRSKVILRVAQNVEAAIASYVAYFQIHAELRHGPLLADLVGRAFSLQHRSTLGDLLRGNFQTQIA